MYMAASTLQQAVAGSLFGLVIIGFIALIVLIVAGAKGSGRMDF